MPTNKYFQSGRGIGSTSEQNLLQQIANEAIQMAGADFVYIPRNLVKLDDLFHEDTLSSFTKNFTIEMLIENYDAFLDRKSTRLNSSHSQQSRMPSSA